MRPRSWRERPRGLRGPWGYAVHRVSCHPAPPLWSRARSHPTLTARAPAFNPSYAFADGRRGPSGGAGRTLTFWHGDSIEPAPGLLLRGKSASARTAARRSRVGRPAVPSRRAKASRATAPDGRRRPRVAPASRQITPARGGDGASGCTFAAHVKSAASVAARAPFTSGLARRARRQARELQLDRSYPATRTRASISATVTWTRTSPREPPPGPDAVG
ncbi:MAG: hypothetical protein QOJ29_1883 [Thermoleophilaceae bacterium]|jgi:hypothetical protein|nr:hypothetical protein [Thermoleophilaceae bacterium]